MPSCKICGSTVLAGLMVHNGCLGQRLAETAEKFCDGYCKWPSAGIPQEELDEICAECPMGRLEGLVR